MLSKIHNVLKELKEELKHLYGERLSTLILFGSYARGEETTESDIDLLVVLKGEVRHGREVEHGGNLTAAISLAYDMVISCIYMSEERFLHEQSPLLLNIRKDGQVL